MNHTILITDDEPHILKLIQIPLESLGYTTISCHNGNDAWDKIQKHLPSMVISDINMPGKSGFELMELAHSHPQTQSIPFIFLTARNAIKDKIRGLELGADEYLTKPFHIDELVIRVKSTLQRVEEAAKAGTTTANELDGIYGNLQHMSLPDLLQVLELGWKTGIITITHESDSGIIFVKDGKIIHVVWHKLFGEEAFFRLMRWQEGQFQFVEQPLDMTETMSESSQGLVMESLRQSDEINKIKKKFTGRNAIFEIDQEKLAASNVPDDYQKILMLIDGQTTLSQLEKNCPFNALTMYRGLDELFALDVIYPAE